MTMLAITYPNEDRSLLTLAELRTAVGSSSITDANLSLLGDYISAAITRACKVATVEAIPPTLREEGVAESFRVRVQTGYLALARKPVVEVSLVIENDVPLDASAYEIDGSLLYKLSGNGRICWPCGLIEVDYTAGYEIVPADLKYAAIRFVQAEVANVVSGGRDPFLKMKKIEGVSEYQWWVDPAARNSVVPADVMSLLDLGGYVRMYGWMK